MKTTESTTPSTDIRKEKRPGTGGYRGLRAFQLATIIYDATVSFCDRFVDRGSRTHDRMVQAGRCGRQHIAAAGRAGEAVGTTAAHVFKEARNSLDELLLDYEDFLRQRKLRVWSRDDSEAQAVRSVARESERSAPLQATAYAAWLEHKDPAIAANALVCLLHQTDYLLARQAAALGQGQFKQDGGRDQGAAAGSAGQPPMKHPGDSSDTQEAPACLLCGRPMALRTARTGKNEGRTFWGCTGYPECKGKAPGKKTV
jgi:four helix bundle suffix protein